MHAPPHTLGAPRLLATLRFCALAPLTHTLEGSLTFVVGNGSGQRNDIHDLRDAIKRGRTDEEIFNDDNLLAPAVKFARGRSDMRTAYRGAAPPRPTHKLQLCIGPPGTGKSYCCAQEPDLYWKTPGQWWLNYRGEKAVIIDDMGPGVLSMHDFKRYLDVYVSVSSLIHN